MLAKEYIMSQVERIDAKRSMYSRCLRINVFMENYEESGY